MAKKTVRKHLFEDDVKVLIKLRGLKNNPFKPLKGTDPVIYRPRTTIEEWTKIKEAREKKRSEGKVKPSKTTANYIKKICSNPSLQKENKISILSKHLNMDNDGVLKLIDFVGASLTPSQFSKAKFHKLKKAKRYLISSAQNASEANLDLLKNMDAYAKYIGAEIGIIATRYRNPTSVWNLTDTKNDVWDNAVLKYLTAKRQDLHPDLCLLADLKIQATSPNPTNGIELFGGHKSLIVGAPRIEFQSVPVFDSQKQKFLYSTGSVTKPNFTDTVAGGKAAEHHSFGFVVVEIEDKDTVHVRNISASSDGSFNDLIFRVENGKVTKEDVELMVWGDLHSAQKDERVTKAFRGACKDLGVSISVLHDVWDSESVNVHNLNNPVIQHELMVRGKDDLEKELDQMYGELDWFEENMKKTFVVASNHDDMLDRTLAQGDWRSNLKNARLFVSFLKLTLDLEAPDGIIPYLISQKYKNIEAWGLNTSYIHRGVELALHGHKGANGGKGNKNGFSKLCSKTIVGHSHSPSIKWGCYQVGIACSLDHGYNKGVSGWTYAGCILNKRGKRQMIVFNRRKFSYTTLI